MFKPERFTVLELVTIATFAALNLTLSIAFATPLKPILGHIFAGMLIFVPLDLLLATLARKITGKFLTYTIYFAVFGALCIPFAIWGLPGWPLKIVVGLVTGFLLDVVYNGVEWIFSKINLSERVKKVIAAIVLGVVFPFAWWTGVFGMWALVGFPAYKALITGIGTWEVFKPFTADLLVGAIMVILITIPDTILAVLAAYGIWERIKDTTAVKRIKAV